MKLLFKSPYSERKNDTKPFWKQYYEMLKLFISLNYLPAEYYCFKFHHKNCSQKDMLKFMPYSWFLRNVNNHLTFKSWEPLFVNKLDFNTYARSKGLAVPKDYGIYNTRYGYDIENASNISNAHELHVFLKKSGLRKIVFKDLSGKQGRNIYFISDIIHEEESIQLMIDGRKFSIEDFVQLLGNGEFLIQEHLGNNNFLNTIFPNSMNTFRVISFYNKENTVKILGVLLRTGIGKNQVDNWHRGGLVIPVDLQTGCFIDYGYDYSYKTYAAHPDSNFIFRDVKIPFWDEMIKFVQNCALAFPMMRFIAWDISCTNEGLFILEANVRNINLFVNQLSTNGMSEMIREDLRALGYVFPSERIPPITIKKVAHRIIQVGKRLFSFEK